MLERGQAERAQREAERATAATAGLREAVALLSQSLGLALSPERSASLEAMDAPALRALLLHLAQERSWPLTP